MKASVCELPNDWTENPAVIQALKDHNLACRRQGRALDFRRILPFLQF